MSLEQYKQKRDFKKTPEPTTSAPSKKKIFVVQRHHASHLHYDFRLELGGTLKSWAVPKGPSLHPADKRLAMRVEDHPVSYATFEGTIPEGNYGAGHVDVWDHGTYEPVDKDGKVISDAAFTKDLKNGSIKFLLKGRKLKGEFALVNMHQDEKTWLLIKHQDKYATEEQYNAEDYAKKSSLAYTQKRLSKKTAGKKAAAKKPASSKKKNEVDKITPSRWKASQPQRKLTNYIKPMLASTTDEAFDGENWIFEIKWDGYRAIAEVDRSNVKLYSRNGLSFENTYPVIFDALSQLKIRAVLDGEIVAMNKNGLPDFQALQYHATEEAALVYQVFDLIALNGKKLTDQPLSKRKELLRNLLPENDLIRYSDHVAGDGKAFFEAAKEKDLEGIMAKLASSRYIEGKRSRDWLKIKHHFIEEAVIAGYTAPRGGRNYFGALVLGMYQGKQLRYIGHTGTGFSDKILKAVFAEMQPEITGESPFNEPIKVNAPVTWLRPRLVANIKFSEVTKDGLRRHPVFMGMRMDKNAKEVAMKKELKPAGKPAKTTEKGKKKPSALTNPEKLYWKKEGITKGDMIDYYNTVYKYIIPYLKDRPQSLHRFPNGIDQPSFFHKDAGENVPGFIDTYAVWSDSANKTVDYIVCNNKPSLQYIANLGCIELNPWNSRTATPDKPDYMVLDLDPSDKNTYDEVVDCALVIKELCDRIKIKSYCKTSGASGLHIYIPLQAKYDYEHVRSFAELLAHHVLDTLPETTTLVRSLSKRKKDHIYLDYLQNKQGATLCSVYSLRPKPFAPVSTPLEWKEVKHGLDPRDFNIKNVLTRLQKKGDLFAPVLKRGIDMEKSLQFL
ncbi:MAG TPA: DNA ligase D [Flavipsychrobacter sp.]|nr:DNA ligase D [Flavipsychrobacter sp.]